MPNPIAEHRRIHEILGVTASGIAGGTSVHDQLTGLLDDDHTQYLLVDGSRQMTGDLDMGDFDITTSGNVDGVDVSKLQENHTTHITNSSIHFTEASIDHDSITNTHNLTSDIDHTTIQNIGSNTHAAIDAHIADSGLHSAGESGVYTSGDPNDNELAIWTASGIIEGNSTLTYDAGVLQVSGINLDGSTYANTLIVKNAADSDAKVLAANGFFLEATGNGKFTSDYLNLYWITTAFVQNYYDGGGIGLRTKSLTSGTTGDASVYSGPQVGTGASGNVNVYSGAAGAASGDVNIYTGNSTSNNSGDVILKTGTASGGTPGSIYFKTNDTTALTIEPLNQGVILSDYIRLANTTNAVAGNLRWDGSHFQGNNGATWVNLDGAGGDAILIQGTPADNQIAVWTSASGLEGASTLTWDGSTLAVGGDISTSTGSRDFILINNFTDALQFTDGTDTWMTIDTSTGAEGVIMGGYLRLNNTNDMTAGNIRWNGTSFQGSTGVGWVYLDGSDSVSREGEVADNQLAIWTATSGIEGSQYLTFDGSTLTSTQIVSNTYIRVGGASEETAGNIRLDGTDFQGYNGATWVTFGGGVAGINGSPANNEIALWSSPSGYLDSESEFTYDGTTLQIAYNDSIRWQDTTRLTSPASGILAVWLDDYSQGAQFDAQTPGELAIKGMGGVPTLVDATGALRLGTTTDTTAGNIRWSSGHFSGYTGAEWVNLDSTGAVDVDGTPADNQIAIWTDSNTLEGDPNLLFDGSGLQVRDNIAIELGTNKDYWWEYSSTAQQLELWSANTDGASTPGRLIVIEDGTATTTISGILDAIDNTVRATNLEAWNSAGSTHKVDADGENDYIRLSNTTTIQWNDNASLTTGSLDTAIGRYAAGKVLMGNSGLTQAVSFDTTTDNELHLGDEGGSDIILDVAGVRLGWTTEESNGVIRWSGSSYQGWKDGTGWVALDSDVAGYVTVSGAAVDNQVAVFNTPTSIEGDANFTWDGTTFDATNIRASGNGGDIGWGGGTKFTKISEGIVSFVNDSGQGVRFDVHTTSGLLSLYDQSGGDVALECSGLYCETIYWDPVLTDGYCDGETLQLGTSIGTSTVQTADKSGTAATRPIAFRSGDQSNGGNYATGAVSLYSGDITVSGNEASTGAVNIYSGNSATGAAYSGDVNILVNGGPGTGAGVAYADGSLGFFGIGTTSQGILLDASTTASKLRLLDESGTAADVGLELSSSTYALNSNTSAKSFDFTSGAKYTFQTTENMTTAGASFWYLQSVTGSEATASSGTQYGLRVESKKSQSGTAGFRGLHIGVDDNGDGTGQDYLIYADWDAGGPHFTVEDTGDIYTAGNVVTAGGEVSTSTQGVDLKAYTVDVATTTNTGDLFLYTGENTNGTSGNSGNVEIYTGASYSGTAGRINFSVDGSTTSGINAMSIDSDGYVFIGDDVSGSPQAIKLDALTYDNTLWLRTEADENANLYVNTVQSLNGTLTLGSATPGNAVSIFSYNTSTTVDSGDVSIRSGSQINSGNYASGDLLLYTGDTTDDGDTGDVKIYTGIAGAGIADAGDIYFAVNGAPGTGTTAAFVKGSQGFFGVGTLAQGIILDAATTDGRLRLTIEDGATLADLELGTTFYQYGANVYHANATVGGAMNVYAVGTSTAANGGHLNLYTGNQTNSGDYDSGDVNIYTGTTDTLGQTGDINIYTGNAAVGSGHITIDTGTVSGGSIGKIWLKAGAVTALTVEADAGVKIYDYLRLANTSDATDGNIRWDGSNFQGYKTGTWHNLDEAGSSLVASGVQLANEIALWAGDDYLTSDSSFTYDGSTLQLAGADTLQWLGRCKLYSDADSQLQLTNNAGQGLRFYVGTADKLILTDESGNSDMHLALGGTGGNSVLSFNNNTGVIAETTAGGTLGIYTQATSTAVSTGAISLYTGNQQNSGFYSSGDIDIYTGTSATVSGDSGSIDIYTGNASSDSGDILLSTGSAGVVEGEIYLQPGGTTALKVRSDNALEIASNVTEPSSITTNYGVIYGKTDGKVYWKHYGGSETDLTGAGSVQATGTPSDGQIAVWTNSNTIEGSADFTYDSGFLKIAASDVFQWGSTTRISSVADGKLRITDNSQALGIRLEIGSGEAWTLLTDADAGARCNAYGGFYNHDETFFNSSTLQFTNVASIYTKNQSGLTNSGSISLSTGDQTYSGTPKHSGDISVFTGDSTDGDSGDISLDTGAASSGTVGSIYFKTNTTTALKVRNDSYLEVIELASEASSITSGYGALYAKTDGKLYYKAHDGAEADLTFGGGLGGVGGGVLTQGSPVDNQIAIWVASGVIEGDPDLTYNGTILQVGEADTIQWDGRAQLRSDGYHTIDITNAAGQGISLDFTTDNEVLLKTEASGSIILGVSSVRLGTTSDTTAGNIRWDGSNFQGYTGATWVNLDTQGGAGGGDVYTSGNPSNNQLAIWTASGIIEGDSDLTYDGSTLLLGESDVLQWTGDSKIYSSADDYVEITNAAGQGVRLDVGSVNNRLTVTSEAGDDLALYADSFATTGGAEWGDSTFSLYWVTNAIVQNNYNNGGIILRTKAMTSGTTGAVSVYSGVRTGAGNSGPVAIYSGTAGSTTGDISLYSGDSSGGNSGNVTLETGTAASTVGSIYLKAGGVTGLTVETDATVTVGQGFTFSESSGPTALTVGSITDGQVLVRSGSTITSQAAATGTVDTNGTPADNQVAVFTDQDTIEGDANFTWDSSTFTLQTQGVANYAYAYLDTYSSSDPDSRIVLRKSHQNTVGNAATVNWEYIGHIQFYGNSGAGYTLGGSINARQRGTAGTYTPMEISFTTSDGTTTYTSLTLKETGIVYSGTGYECTDAEHFGWSSYAHLKTTTVDGTLVIYNNAETQGIRLVTSTANQLTIQNEGGSNAKVLAANGFYVDANTWFDNNEIRWNITQAANIYHNNGSYDLNIYTATDNDATTGDVNIYTGLNSGAGWGSGALKLYTGATTTTGFAGDIIIYTGAAASGASYDGDIVFGTGGDPTGSGDEVLRIDPNGGYGGTTPSLQVNGTTRLSATADGNLLLINSGNTQGIIFNTTTADATLTVQTESGGNAQVNATNGFYSSASAYVDATTLILDYSAAIIQNTNDGGELWISTDISSANATGQLKIYSGAGTGFDSGDISVYSGNTTTSGNTGGVNIYTGNAAVNSGDVLIYTGSAGTTVGSIIFGVGSSTTLAYFDADGLTLDSLTSGYFGEKIYGYGSGGSYWTGYHAGGTRSSATATPSDTILARFGGAGYDGASWSNPRADIRMYSSQNWSATEQGAYIVFRTTAYGGTSSSEKARLSDEGYLWLIEQASEVSGVDAGFGSIYPKTDGHIYYKAHDGTETALDSAGGVDTSGSPASTHVAVFSDGDTITGSSSFVYEATGSYDSGPCVQINAQTRLDSDGNGKLRICNAANTQGVILDTSVDNILDLRNEANSQTMYGRAIGWYTGTGTTSYLSATNLVLNGSATNIRNVSSYGDIRIFNDDEVLGLGHGGDIDIYTGDLTHANDYDSGYIKLATGSSNNTAGDSGSITLQTGAAATNAGDIIFQTDGTNTRMTIAGDGGDVDIANDLILSNTSGSSIYQSSVNDSLSIYTADNVSGNTGTLSIQTGDSSSGSGALTIETGTGDTLSGALTIQTGNAGGALDSGVLTLKTGTSSSGSPGDIDLYSGSTLMMKVDGSAGRIGINTSTPDCMLDIEESRAAAEALRVINTADTDTARGIYIAAGKDTPASNSDCIWLSFADGDFSLVSYVGYSTSSPYAAFYSWSDARLKKNIKDTEVEALDIINRLPLKSFDWKDKKRPSQTIGFVAQDVESVFPGMVGTGPDGFKSVNESALIKYLVKAVQELSAEIEKLKKEKN